MTSATGRPTDSLPLVPRLFLGLAAGVAFLEWVLFMLRQRAHGSRALARLVLPALQPYLAVRAFCLAYPVAAALLAALATVLLLLAVRAWLLLWHNQLRARLTGTHFAQEAIGFPRKRFALLKQLLKRKKGWTFVGLTRVRGLFGWRWTPFRLTDAQRSMHTHVLGKTGSGKTTSVLWPQVLQDALDGKGVLVMDAKGSDENIRTMKGIAAVAGRQADLRVFALPAWNSPAVFSHRYNMLWVEPRRPGLPVPDVSPMSERVFGVLPLGDNAYYNVQAQVLFTHLCRLLHGMVDGRGHGLPFAMRDVAVALKGIGATDGFGKAFKHCLTASVERDAAREIQNQVARLGTDVRQCFSGLIGAVDRFRSPLVNAYAPDLVFERALEQNHLVYAQLPGNLFKVQAPAVGRAMLMDVQQEGALRQVLRGTRNQRPFSVVVDEFYNFADLSIVDSLNKLRDAQLHFTLAHQSVADLELVSKEFATSVWDNTRTKIILNQDNPELCEKVSKSIGTHQVVERTVRQQQGALFTSLVTGDASRKQIEAFRLHPNAIKALAPAGQGYCYFGSDIVPLALGELPRLELDYPLERNGQDSAPGLRLEERFVSAADGVRGEEEE